MHVSETRNQKLAKGVHHLFDHREMGEYARLLFWPLFDLSEQQGKKKEFETTANLLSKPVMSWAKSWLTLRKCLHILSL